MNMVARPKPTVWVPPPLPPGDPRHGTLNGYNNYGCRCEDCKHARHIAYITKRDQGERNG